ncbi:hypothetical protein GCM10025859_67430 [Alicyclobacillus fastidiosus]|nr:hypothetical protein GCM10025859_67430 [Alicyclobacillus fastidiosus]
MNKRKGVMCDSKDLNYTSYGFGCSILNIPQYEGYPYSRYKPKTVIPFMFKQSKLYKL